MKSHATTRRWALLLLPLFALAPLLPVGSQAYANGPALPPPDHYWVYRVSPNPPVTGLVILEDQFGKQEHDVFRLELFSNPVSKQGGLIHDPDLHYSWWSFPPHEFSASVTVDNQFGEQVLDIGSSVFLLNPALKAAVGTPLGDLPVRNHYKCYKAQGQPVNRMVTLRDQFQEKGRLVDFPEFFCNPVQKTAFGVTHPIVDSLTHLVCYRITPNEPVDRTADIKDQFLPDRLSIGFIEDVLLCVPSRKTGFVAAESGTWGRIKALYR